MDKIVYSYLAITIFSRSAVSFIKEALNSTKLIHQVCYCFYAVALHFLFLFFLNIIIICNDKVQSIH